MVTLKFLICLLESATTLKSAKIWRNALFYWHCSVYRDTQYQKPQTQNLVAFAQQ